MVMLNFIRKLYSNIEAWWLQRIIFKQILFCVTVQYDFKITNLIYGPGYVSKWVGYALGDQGICLASA
jgi:hypothetical protein